VGIPEICAKPTSRYSRAEESIDPILGEKTMSISLQTLMPSVVTPNTQILVTDIDKDKINEVIMLDSNLRQLSICHQFSYSEISLNNINSSIWSSTQPLWPNATTSNWMTTWAVPQGGIPVPQGATFGPWQVAPGDVIMAADVDGDGTDELFIYNPESLTWGILKWQSGGLQTIAKLNVAPGSGGRSVTPPLTAVSWQGSAADQFFILPSCNIVPFVIPKASAILVYNPQTYALAIIAYGSNCFAEPWNTTAGSLGGWQLNPNHPDPTINYFYPGFFTAAGVPSIAVYSPTTNYMALLQWDATQKTFTSSPGQSHQAGGWDYGSLDQHQVADLDGDGLSEIFVYAPNDANIGMLKFVNGSFQSYGITSQQFGTKGKMWQPGNNDKYFCMNGSGSIPGLIYAYASNPLNFGVLCYQQLNTMFDCVWTGTSLAPNNAWKVTASDTFYAGLPGDSATPSLITLSNQSPSVLTLGGLSWNGKNVNTGYQVQFVSSGTVPVPAWSPTTLASNAPATAFPLQWPNPAQQAIYGYISQLFPIPGAANPTPTTNIRSLYTSFGDMGKFQDFATGIEKYQTLSSIPSNWPALPAGNNWQNTDWATVLNTIVNECNQVNTAYSMYLDIGSLAEDLNTFQVADLATVDLNIKQLVQTSPESKFDYWLGQVFVAIVVGLAAGLAILAGPEAIAFGVFIDMVASLIGSAVGYNPKQLESLEEDEVAKQITDTLSNSIVSNSLDLSAILKDPVKMNILNGLHDNVWLLDTSLPSTIKEPFQTVDRLGMYQLLMPISFSITAFGPGSNPPEQGATYTLGNINYCLKGDNYISASEFQGTTLYTDLFKTIGVTEQDFFLGNGAWADIPRTTYS
jgi:hypothetical protein